MEGDSLHNYDSSQVYMISAVICMSLRGLWHFCNLPCVYALFWLVSIASYVFKSPSICFQGTININREDIVYLHSVVYLQCRRFYNDMGLVPKFRNGKRRRKILEKQNIRLKPEIIDYLCFSPRWILRLPRYSLTFGFPRTPPPVHSLWCQWHNCSSNMTRIQALFWLGNTSNRQGLLRCASLFLFRARFLRRSAICKLAMKSNVHVHQVTVPLTDTYSLGLLRRSLILDIQVILNWHLWSICSRLCSPVSREYIAGSS